MTSYRIAKYGWREIGLGLLLALVMAVPCAYASPYLLFLPLLVIIFVLQFFRHPRYDLKYQENWLVAPAEGRIVTLEEVDEPVFIQGRAVKIGIFLSVFNAHINTSPVKGKVVFLQYNHGKFLNALYEESSRVNENNLIGISRAAPNNGKVLVKQISGAIARRIVPDVRLEQELCPGDLIGMIKFGSRTEVYVPVDAARPFEVNVRLKDKVYAGGTVLGEWK